MKKVLILEDEINIRSFVVINLKRAGYDAVEAGTGQEALDKHEATPEFAKYVPIIQECGELKIEIMEK